MQHVKKTHCLSACIVYSGAISPSKLTELLVTTATANPPSSDLADQHFFRDDWLWSTPAPAPATTTSTTTGSTLLTFIAGGGHGYLLVERTANRCIALV